MGEFPILHVGDWASKIKDASIVSKVYGIIPTPEVSSTKTEALISKSRKEIEKVIDM